MRKRSENLKSHFRNFINTYVPRWIIFIIDLVIVIGAFISLWLVHDSLSTHPPKYFFLKLSIAVGIYALTSIITKSYHGVVRFSSINDIGLLARSAALATALFFIISIVANIHSSERFYLWFPPIHGLMVLAGQLLFRFVIKYVYARLESSDIVPKKRRAFILGSDSKTVNIANYLMADKSSSFKPVAFITLQNSHSNKSILGLPVILESGNMLELMKEHKVKTMLLIHQVLDEIPKEFYDRCIVLGLEILLINNVSQIEEKGKAPIVNKIKIEDLLGRNVIEMSKEAISHNFEGQNILITGAAGSIGSEIARKVASFNCSKIILVDQAETALNNLWLELKSLKNGAEIKAIVANVSSKKRMQQVFECSKPSIVFHAAAYKHVPMMELHPSTAVVTNVQGTKNCADLSLEMGVKRFVMISTDKAVNPTNVMGATKRAAEIYIQSLAEESLKTNPNATQFITTRFGNVLGSNGSVVPLFHSQIERGGPVTITHKEIIRYFMTISEACSLVLEAGCTGSSGEIYIFDMGEPVKIYDLAEKMIHLSGKVPGKDIEIVEIGLRPGEKLYEELLASSEENKPTYHKKIMIAKVRRYNFKDIEQEFIKLIELAKEYDNSTEVVKRLKLMIPEFKSENSSYSSLDQVLELELGQATHTLSSKSNLNPNPNLQKSSLNNISNQLA